MPHVWTGRSGKRSCEYGMRISEVQPLSVIFVAESHTAAQLTSSERSPSTTGAFAARTALKVGRGRVSCANTTVIGRNSRSAAARIRFMFSLAVELRYVVPVF